MSNEQAMIRIILHKNGQIYEGEIGENTNLVVQAGIRRFPHPNLSYRCGMGKCATCACKVLAGADHLPSPNWKERKQLGKLLDDGYRLVCQLWLTHDIELTQDIEPVHPHDAEAASAVRTLGEVKE